MTKHDQVADIFERALMLEGRARDEFVSRRCADQPELRAEVESILVAHDSSGGFMKTSLPGSGLMANDPAIPSQCLRAGDRLGRYEILNVIASGGMGTVYRAARADGECRQIVAVKLVRREHESEALSQRLLQERQLLASLEHPNITRLIDAGTTSEGTPFFVMEFVDGVPIDEFCEAQGLSVRRRLEIFQLVCGAVSYAHQKLIVHRDLKPSNMLVDGGGQPKLLDFGISKILGEAGAGLANHDGTVTISRALTPRYASPEHWRGEQITTGTDVYSLGVILYELLTGRAPFHFSQYANYDQLRKIHGDTRLPPSQAVRNAEVPAAEGGPNGGRRKAAPPSRHRALRGDLDNIVLKAMHHDLSQRYVSVEKLSEDVDRYLKGLPVLARKDTLSYRAARFFQRNRAAVMASGMAVLAMMAGATASLVAMVSARRAEQVAQEERNVAMAARADSEEVIRFLQETLSRANPYRHAREVTMVELLDAAGEKANIQLADRPAVEAGVRMALGTCYADMWLWTSAHEHMEIAAGLYRDLHDDERRAKCLSILGRAMTFAKDPRCIETQMDALAIREALYGPRHASVAESWGNLGYALWHGTGTPNWAKAEKCYRKSLAMYDRLADTQHKDYARFTFSLAVMLKIAHRYEESESLFRDALDIYRNLPQREDRYASECMIKFASLLVETEQFEEADALLKEARSLVPDSMHGTRDRISYWMRAVLR
ncbi:MAG: protein kinase domain-containing protein [Planctomycetota bacterium]|jgi:serine/threonine protein kinase